MFFIIDGDKPIYEVSIPPAKEELRTLLEVHSTLDELDDYQVTKRNCFCGFLKFEEPTIVCQTTPTNLRMILLLNLTKKECTKQAQERIKGFFERVSEYLGTAIMNPLYRLHTEITSPTFDVRVRQQITKRLSVFIDKK